MLSPTIEYNRLPLIDNYHGIDVGKRLIIAAESYEGPLYEPTLIYNLKLAESIFRSGPLIERYKDAMKVDDSIAVIFVRMRDNDYSTVYRCLQSYSFDLIYLDEFNYKDQSEIDAFIEFATDKELQGDLIHGFLDIDTAEDIQFLREVIQHLTFEDITDIHEMGKYISLVSDQALNHSSAVIYAALIVSIEPGVSPVNKTLNIKLEKVWNKEELILFQNIGVVTFRESIKNGIICSNATCAVSTSGSVHKHISNFRIVQYLIQELSNTFQYFIGNIQSESQIRKIQEIIEAKIEEYITLGRLKNGEYAIMENGFEGRIYINLDVVPIFSVNRITAHSQIRVMR
ncbi:hypothetical protein [Virgibacillus salexigens]|uniref:Phage tail sheath protein n=1 Tax=Virgibacillus massiliensis TaxID=1462526 RepID=A0A024QIM9_9BACI|nr:hypothetical protein [Virgibacillus massiliensis]CDQ41816.1 hypothetical protein BN990_04193 [Virgibacillus massiliensis]